MKKRRKAYELERSVVYSPSGKDRHKKNISEGKEIRKETIEILKQGLTDMSVSIGKIEDKINIEVIKIKAFNRSDLYEKKYTVRWESKKNPIGRYGPYWMESFDDMGIKKYKSISQLSNKSSCPSKRQLIKSYGVEAEYINNSKRNINMLKTKKRHISNTYSKLINLIVKETKNNNYANHLFGNYLRNNNVGGYERGLYYRERYLMDSLDLLDYLNHEMVSLENDIEKEMYGANIITAKRFGGILVSWELFASGRNRKEQKLSPFGPIYPQWRQINRWTPNIHNQGVRQIKNIKLTRDIIYKGQQGMIGRELIDYRNSINRLEKDRQKIIKLLRMLWRCLSPETRKVNKNEK